MDKDEVHIYYNGILLGHQEEWNNAFCINIDGSRECHTKWIKSKTNIIWDHLYVKSKKKKMQMDFFTKPKQTHIFHRQTYGYQRGKVRWDKLGIWD